MIKQGEMPKTSVKGFEGADNVKGRFSGRGHDVNPKTGLPNKEQGKKSPDLDLAAVMKDLISVEGTLSQYKSRLVMGKTRNASSDEMSKIRDMIKALEGQVAQAKRDVEALKEKMAMQKSQQAAAEPDKTPMKVMKGATKGAQLGAKTVAMTRGKGQHSA